MTRNKYLTESEITKLLNYCKSLPALEKLMVFLPLFLGLREDEVWTLKKTNFDLEKAVLKLNYCKNEGREIPIPSMLYPVLEEYLSSLKDEEYVFQTKKSSHITSYLFKLKEITEGAGLTDITPNILRSTCISFMVTGGVSANDIRRAIGYSVHESILPFVKNHTSSNQEISNMYQYFEEVLNSDE